MSIKRILLPINGCDDIAPVGKLAFDVAKKMKADVEVLHPYTPYYDVITAVGVGGSPAQINSDIQYAKTKFEQEIAQAKQVYSELVEANAEVKTEFVEMAGKTSEIITQRAFSSDLIVLGSAGSFDSTFWRDVYDGALIHSTRPVLVAPNQSTTAEAAQNFASDVLIAWNGTAESTRAVSAAEPLFADAQQVRFLTVGDDKKKAESAEQMTQYAKLHGANASAHIIEAGNNGVAQVLLNDASAKPGTLLVMGAYSHARWRERVFGGVTEHVLHHADVQVLMSH
jgi:nucleotide-binding universal stress UspA family protein